MMLTRKREPELMDDPLLDGSSHAEALKGLELLNLVSTSADLVWAPIKKLCHQLNREMSVLDLATGSGDILRGIHKRSEQSHTPLRLVGADISQTAVSLARAEAAKIGARISFMQLDVLNETIPERFDIVTTSLFTHHLDPPEVIKLLKHMAEVASEMVIVNDLVRSEFAYGLVWLATRLFTRSAIVQFDGPVSVRASYTMSEMQEMAEVAGLTGASINFAPPCRMLLVWRKGRD